MKCPVDSIVELFEARGMSQYGGEAVSQLEHALQTALMAEANGANDELIAAALLHDIGHLLHELPDDAPDTGIDDRHEVQAERFLTKHFEAAVVEPVRLHVAAKRYLCAVDPDYLSLLSEPSIVSLKLQGGAMSPAEVAEFESNPFHESAVALRRWDDEAKVAGLPTPSLSHFEGALRRAYQLGSESNKAVK